MATSGTLVAEMKQVFNVDKSQTDVKLCGFQASLTNEGVRGVVCLLSSLQVDTVGPFHLVGVRGSCAGLKSLQLPGTISQQEFPLT